MNHPDLSGIARDLEAATAAEARQVIEAIAALAAVFPDGGATAELDPAVLESSDILLDIIARALPGWSVEVDGAALSPNGHWRCALSPANGAPDDGYLATGRGPTLPHALLVALLNAMAPRA